MIKLETLKNDNFTVLSEQSLVEVMEGLQSLFQELHMWGQKQLQFQLEEELSQVELLDGELGLDTTNLNVNSIYSIM